MTDARFYLPLEVLAVADALRIAAEAGVAVAVTPDVDPAARLDDVAALSGTGGPTTLVYADTVRALGDRKADYGLCLVVAQALGEKAFGEERGPGLAPRLAGCASPRLAFARIAARLFRVRPAGDAMGVAASARIGVRSAIHPTAIVSPDVEIGESARLGPYAVIGPGVRLGDGAQIGAGASVFCTIAGSGLSVNAGARIGEAGFGFVPGPRGPERTPQLGRVLIGEDVEIGANSTVDRGALGDTVIGAGTKIDNLVQIAHNVVIGRSCVFAAQMGVAGSTVFGDGVFVGGQAGFADHLTIGAGAEIAARSGVMSDTPPGERWGGFPARPIRRWLRETATLARLAGARKKVEKSGD